MDTEIKHSGRASLRLENFTANPYGHGRVMQEVAVQPHRCYRVTLWVKTDDLQPAGAFRVMALAGQDREIAPRTFNIPSTTDWRKISMLFNSLHFDKIRLYAGIWGGKSGKIWLDDWSIEEVGPVNVLHRPGTPVTIRSEDGSVTYIEGKRLRAAGGPALHPWHDDEEALPLKMLPGGRIQEGADRARQLVSFDDHLRFAGDRLHGRAGALPDFRPGGQRCWPNAASAHASC